MVKNYENCSGVNKFNFWLKKYNDNKNMINLQHEEDEYEIDECELLTESDIVYYPNFDDIHKAYENMYERI